MRLSIIGILFAFLAATFAWQAEATGGKSEKSDSKVKAAVSATKLGADGKQTVTITLDVEKDWYIYANPVNSNEYEPNRTRVTFKAKEKVTASINYPAGKTKMKYDIYQGKVVIPCQITRTPGDTSPLEVSIQVNACGIVKEECLPPATIKLTIP